MCAEYFQVTRTQPPEPYANQTQQGQSWSKTGILCGLSVVVVKSVALLNAVESKPPALNFVLYSYSE